jgi:NADH-quinone oxidoreductase subunit L
LISETATWLIVGLPLASFVVIGLVVRPFFNRWSIAAGWLTILAVGASLVLSLYAAASLFSHGPIDTFPSRAWVIVPGLTIPFGLMLDPLTAVMLVVAAGVSLLVQVYSQGYMKGDPGYARYYAYMSLFTASMLGLVLARSIVQLFFFWELVGLCSYLLIGFWFTRPAAADAAKKAFLVTRLGDFGFLLAILYLYSKGGELLDIPTLYGAVHAGLIATSVATWIGLGVFAGAVGKSAQFPLHTWLPDAMEGPTPVSALIHAATMVAAGVFLVARFFPLIELSATAMNMVAMIGGVTAVFAATMGLVANDIKRVMAYSTVSQLGYMMLALGVGAYIPAIFHLFTHAWFKALLFLSAGSVNHASGTFDMRYMGGLRRYMPATYTVMVVGGLSLAGIFPLAGFWSKDEVLAGALDSGSSFGVVAFALGLAAVLMTAFYMFRAVFMTFHGSWRGGAEAEAAAARTGVALAPATAPHGHGQGSGHGGVHLAESPLVMVGPLVVLAVLAVVAGALVNPPRRLGPIGQHGFGSYLAHNEAVFPDHEAEISAGAEPHFNILVAVVSTALAVGGIGAAYALYGRGRVAVGLPRLLQPVHDVLARKYYFDELYERVIVRDLFYRRFAAAIEWIDSNWIDGLNVRVSVWTGHAGRAMTQLQNGQVQAYGVAIFLGVIVTLAVYFVWGT